ncbi:helix-turn-helix domain-containing protein [Streptomyces sp. WAC04657]|uniref:helix-turn-helix domain-containing protein n=1 Tax=Streptomyces sp. WAC04657 TaxID=1779145 RepID=UPI00131E8178|nr:helix-turn-helix domain-containing protein [Streptomyces sp. WAC04657]
MKMLSVLIRRRYREGASLAVVARELGVSKSTVRRHVPVRERRDASAAARQRHRSRAGTPYEQALRAQVVRLYGSGMPQRQVAATLGISVEAVVARLEPSQLRSRQEAARLSVEQQGDLLPQEEIVARYVQGATMAELGRLYGVHPTTIRRRIPDHLVRPRSRTPQPRPRRVLVEEEVRRRYAAGESAYALAREFGVSVHTVRARIPDSDWRGRPAEEASASPSRSAQPGSGGVRMVLALSDEEILARYRAGQSATSIGRAAGVDCRTILRRIPEHERRSHFQAQRLNRPAPDVDADTIRALRARGLSWEAIATRVGLSAKTVRARA